MEPDGPFASTLGSEGTPLNVGPLVSPTVTVKLPLAGLPAVSVAEQLTVTVPMEKIEPEAGKQLAGSVPETRSVALAAKVMERPAEEVASAVMLPGRFR
jgi:hypothetical protein